MVNIMLNITFFVYLHSDQLVMIRLQIFEQNFQSINFFKKIFLFYVYCKKIKYFQKLLFFNNFFLPNIFIFFNINNNIKKKLNNGNKEKSLLFLLFLLFYCDQNSSLTINIRCTWLYIYVYML